MSTASTFGSTFLIWEDEGPTSERWWISGARETVAGDRRDFFIAEDDVTEVLVCVMLPQHARRYHILSIVNLADHLSQDRALAAAKAVVAACIEAPNDPVTRQLVQRWRLRRFTTNVWRNLPLALGGFALGGVLGFLVAMFAVSSALVGWPMMAVGLMIGAGAGPVLKYVVDRNAAKAALGPWGRFATATIAAMLGAAVFAGGVFTLFWN
ncbi:MAG: hypothetical protein EXQ84_06340 [Rhodospirillaceae bacterium]|nr:hypothetical protein [Rhodospirillaceae bacterium]